MSPTILDWSDIERDAACESHENDAANDVADGLAIDLEIEVTHPAAGMNTETKTDQNAPPIAPGDDRSGPASDNGTRTAQEASGRAVEAGSAGYTPVPNHGKIPPLKDWQNLQGVTHEQLRMWGLSWPDAINTGVLTRTVPTFDVDILNEDAARAVEDMVREHYEETGPPPDADRSAAEACLSVSHRCAVQED